MSAFTKIGRLLFLGRLLLFSPPGTNQRNSGPGIRTCAWQCKERNAIRIV